MKSKTAVNKIVYSDFYCENCNSKITLPRKKSKQKEKGHIKDIYCYFCKEITKHYEIRNCDIMPNE